MKARDLKKHLPSGSRARATKDGLKVTILDVQFNVDRSWTDPAQTADYLRSRIPVRMKPRQS